MSTIYPVKKNIQIDWSDMDMFGHVNNLAFLKYVQATRVSYWEHIELYQYFERTSIGPILASVRCDYKKPLRYPGDVTVACGLKFIRNTSFGLSYHILNNAGEIAAEAEDIMVLFDFNKNEKMPFPQWIRDNIEKLDQGNGQLG